MDEELIAHLLEENGGVLRMADVIALGISKDRFYNYIKQQSGLEKAAHGIYLSADAWSAGTPAGGVSNRYSLCGRRFWFL